MKIAAAVIAVLSALTAIVLWLLPATLTVLGSDISCGMPVFAALAEPAGPGLVGEFVDQCRKQSIVRAFAGLAVGAVGVGGAVIMWLAAPRPQPWWDGQRWVQP